MIMCRRWCWMLLLFARVQPGPKIQLLWLLLLLKLQLLLLSSEVPSPFHSHFLLFQSIPSSHLFQSRRSWLLEQFQEQIFQSTLLHLSPHLTFSKMLPKHRAYLLYTRILLESVRLFYNFFWTSHSKKTQKIKIGISSTILVTWSISVFRCSALKVYDRRSSNRCRTNVVLVDAFNDVLSFAQSTSSENYGLPNDSLSYFGFQKSQLKTFIGSQITESDDFVIRYYLNRCIKTVKK